jgi:phosphosulfolactate synthase
MGSDGQGRRGRFDEHLSRLGVPELPRAVYPFDPGIAPVVLRSHLEQSGHLMLGLKVSMACWMIAGEDATRSKVQAAHASGVPANTGGGPYEVAVAQGQLDSYLDLCADVGFDGIECGEGFTDPAVGPSDVIAMASGRGLGVDYEIGTKHGGPLDAAGLEEAIEDGRRWLDAGARRLIVEARESAAGVGLFDLVGNFNAEGAERIAGAFGLRSVIFEAPTKPSQFALLDHFGPGVQLSNVRLDEVLRVEIYRRGLHSDAFANPKLRPRAMSAPIMR